MKNVDLHTKLQIYLNYYTYKIVPIHKLSLTIEYYIILTYYNGSKVN